MGGAWAVSAVRGRSRLLRLRLHLRALSANTEYAALIQWIIICIYVSDLEFCIPEREILFYISDWPHLTQNADLILQIFDDNLILNASVLHFTG